MRLKLLLSLGIFSVALSVAHAQLSEGGLPPGFEYGPSWTSVPLYKMPPVDTVLLMEQDQLSATTGAKPLRYGYAQFANITPGNMGTWLTLSGGGRLWTLRIKSPGAYSLSLGFSQLNLPEGAKLFVYNKDYSVVLGAFTSNLHYIDGNLATEQVSGDELMVEYYVPQQADENSQPFEIARVSHDYRNINKILKNFGDAGSCQININCPAGTAYQEIKKSAVMLLVAGSGFCSGNLVNTTDNSGIPYVLTANHCGSNPANWVFRFGWEAATCANPASSPTNFHSLSGATQRAASTGTDFMLVEIGTTPPDSFNVIYAGWDRSGTPATATACISHPNGDIKKIALAPSPVTTATMNSADCWRTGLWTSGCPEPGSSGSALLDQNQRVIGQLYGGPSSCGSAPTSMYDYYGKFSTSWTGGGTSSTRLKDWLDPVNSEDTVVDAFNNAIPALDAALTQILGINPLTCSGATPTIDVVVENQGNDALTSLIINYQMDGGAADSVSWTGNLPLNGIDTVSLFTATTLTTDTHDLSLFISVVNDLPDDNQDNDTLHRSFTALSAQAMLPLTEGFESGPLPPGNWEVGNPDNNITWEQNSTGGFGLSAGSAYINNFDYDGTGQKDYLLSPLINTTGISDLKIVFDVAYARYNNIYSDGLDVSVSYNCGNDWANMYSKSGSVLATAPDQTNVFTPSAIQWRTDTIDISGISDNQIQIRFENICGYGNALYIDHVRILDTSIPLALEEVTFDGEAAVGRNELYWYTQQEQGNMHFVLEKSADGKTFTPLKNINGSDYAEQTRSDYRFTDAQPFAISYYRLDITDGTGKKTYSRVIRLTQQAADLVKIGPNPATTFLNIHIGSVAAGEVTFQTTDVLGKMINRYTETISTGNNHLSINTAALHAGSYVLLVMLPDGAVHREKFVILDK